MPVRVRIAEESVMKASGLVRISKKQNLVKKYLPSVKKWGLADFGRFLFLRKKGEVSKNIYEHTYIHEIYIFKKSLYSYKTFD